jgi:hypothetical protein
VEIVRIGNKKDFLSGLMLVGFGLAVLLLARSYWMGTAFRMGPGYFPVILALLLMVFGIITAGIALRSGKEVAIPKLAWRPLFVVSVTIVLFGLLINGIGLLVMTFALGVVSRLARPGYPWGETAILSAAISAACAAVFYFGLRVQIPLLPAWWG